MLNQCEISIKEHFNRINIDDTEPKIYAVRGPSGIGKLLF